jgi:protein-disulfide isomerase
LSSIHPLAAKAAIAAECAGQQGKFWEYADALFENQEQINAKRFLHDLAERLNLDSSQFASCQNSDMSGLVREESQKASALEIDATPTLFIGGKRYTGLLTLDELT